MSTTVKRLTTTLNPVLFAFVQQESETEKISQRAVLEQALELYRKHKASKYILAGYDALADSSEMEGWLEVANNSVNQ